MEIRMRSTVLRRYVTAPHTAAAGHGVARIARLGSRAGYFELTTFEHSAAARHAVTGAIRQLAGVRAVILDLRRNRGGDESMASFVTSFFFATEAMASERFTCVPLPAAAASAVARMITAPVDVLVSRETSALGHAFAINLERLGRARIVGPALMHRRTA
jgi:C-terminal processing protease CtpA/Prc